MNLKRKSDIKKYEATDSSFTEYTLFECSKDERLKRKKDFINGIDYTPDYYYPNLDNLRFNDKLKKQKTKTYKAVLELEAARPEDGISRDEIKMYTDYHKNHLKRILLVEAARDICRARNDDEREVAKKTFINLNVDIFGDFDTSIFKSMLLTEVENAKLYKPKNKLSLDIKKEFLDYFKKIDLGNKSEELLINENDISKLHNVVLDRYKEIFSIIPDTDDTIFYNSKQCKDIISKTLAVAGLAKKGWSTKIDSDKPLPSTNGTKKCIFLPNNLKRNACELRRLVIHEQEVHARTSVNGKKTGFMPLFFGTENSDDAEEGLAVLLECAVAGNLDNASYNRARDRYITAGLALGVNGEIEPRNARDVFEILWRMLAIRSAKNSEISEEDIVDAKNEAYDHVENAFRGTEFWMAGVIYTKLKVYYEGLKKNAQYFHENINDINHALDVALVGKYDHTDKKEREEIFSILKSIDSKLIWTSEK